MPRIAYPPIALALFLWAGYSLAAPAGTVLFTQTGSQIVDANGIPRPAQRGDVLQHGERLQTPEGGISQVLMQDGSILGVRPGTELRFDPPAANAPTVVSLLQGSVRVIGAELMDARRTSAMTLMSGPATLQLKAADVETTVVGDKRGTMDPGSYSRLLTGTASIGKGALVEPLPTRQVSFVGPTAVTPVTLSSVSPELFGSRLISPSTLTDGAKTATGISSPSLSLSPEGSRLVVAPAPTLTSPTGGLTVSPLKTTLVVAPLPPPPPPPTTCLLYTSPSPRD